MYIPLNGRGDKTVKYLIVPQVMNAGSEDCDKNAGCDKVSCGINWNCPLKIGCLGFCDVDECGLNLL